MVVISALLLMGFSLRIERRVSRFAAGGGVERVGGDPAGAVTAGGLQPPRQGHGLAVAGPGPAGVGGGPDVEQLGLARDFVEGQLGGDAAGPADDGPAVLGPVR